MTDMIVSHSLRDFLKSRLAESRTSFFPGKGRKLICPLCLREITSRTGIELHEALITRNAVNGHPEQDKIMVAFNCVLLDSKCHHSMIGSGGPKIYTACAWHLSQFEGYHRVHNWLTEMVEVFPTVGQEALTRFESV